MRAASRPLLRRAIGLAAVAAMALAATPAVSAAGSDGRRAAPDLRAAAAEAAQQPAATLGRPRSAVPEDRFAMAGGCYAVRVAGTQQHLTREDDTLRATDAGSAEPVHFQSTDLGRYLVYATARDFLAASEGEAGKAAEQVTGSSAGAAVGGLTYEQTDAAAAAVAEGPAGTATGRGGRVLLAAVPSELADWEVAEADAGFTLTLPALERGLAVGEGGVLVLADPSEATPFELALTDGCATWPEIDVNVEGPVPRGPTPYGEVSGYLEAHLHMMAFEFLGGRARCGRPWHPYGVAYALAGCKEHEIAGGRAAVLETVLSGRDPVAGHDTNAGWPTFTDWPKHGSLTYEQVYYKWLERTWRGGLRMFVNLLVDNNQLCKLYPYKRNSCNEMDGVRLQAQRIHELERYIDAQHGGPGRGWFRIVDDPFEARRIMNAGRLAVVLGIEVSVLFDCGIHVDGPKCTKEHIDSQLDAVYAMGVRQMELVNKFDNALSGVTGDSGSTGVIVNGGNFLETGAFWRMQTCADDVGDAHDKHQHNLHDDSGAPEELTGRDSLVGVVLQAAGGSGAAPAYGPGPHCNQVGLSELGEHVIRGMMQRGMIFDPDHMSAKARAQAMDIIESEGYSGVVSSHSWADDTIYPRVIRSGGIVTPHAGTSRSFVEKWRKHRSWADDRYYYGIGFGADTNGFSTQGGPRGADAENAVTYPFTGFGGVTVDRNISGERTWDVNTDGVAHYGLYPDWIEDVRRQLGAEGDQFLADMARGGEAYLQMWERAIGIAPDGCRPDVADLTREDLRQVRKGMTPEEVLLVLGQPARRDGSTFTFCVDGGDATVDFGADGTVTRVRHERQRPAGPGGRREAAAPAAPDQEASTPTVTQVSETAGHDHAAHAHGPVALAASAAGQEAARPVALVLLLGLLLASQLRRRRS